MRPDGSQSIAPRSEPIPFLPHEQPAAEAVPPPTRPGHPDAGAIEYDSWLVARR